MGSKISGFSGKGQRANWTELRVDPATRPGWAFGTERPPAVGDEVYCAAGLAEVVRLLGKTSSGGRLLELRLPGEKRPFFAAESNVLVGPRA